MEVIVKEITKKESSISILADANRKLQKEMERNSIKIEVFRGSIEKLKT